MSNLPNIAPEHSPQCGRRSPRYPKPGLDPNCERCRGLIMLLDIARERLPRRAEKKIIEPDPAFAALDLARWPWPLWRPTARPYDWSWDV